MPTNLWIPICLFVCLFMHHSDEEGLQGLVYARKMLYWAEPQPSPGDFCGAQMNLRANLVFGKETDVGRVTAAAGSSCGGCCGPHALLPHCSTTQNAPLPRLSGHTMILDSSLPQEEECVSPPPAPLFENHWARNIMIKILHSVAFNPQASSFVLKSLLIKVFS